MGLELILIILVSLFLRNGEASGGRAFVGASGTHFAANGNRFFANGFNAYWLMFIASNTSMRSKVSTAFGEASTHGLSLARTWAFSDGGSTPLQISPGSYNEQMFKGLDFVLSEARKYRVRMILSLVNNYDSYGGKKQYVDWARNEGQTINSDDEFFTNPVVRGYYKNHVNVVLTRNNTITGVAYKDDPVIFAWELMNEPRCTSDLSGNTLQAWITEMAAYVKSIDRNHLLEVGLEGFYGNSSLNMKQVNPAGYQVGTDFISNNQILGIDFATLHSYPDQWLSNSSDRTQLHFMNNWLNSHIKDAHKILKKPLLVTEFGKSTNDPGFSISQRDALFNTVYTKIYRSAKTGGAAAGSFFWQLLTEGIDSYRDGYEIVFNENQSTAAVIAFQSRRLNNIGKPIVEEGKGNTRRKQGN